MADTHALANQHLTQAEEHEAKGSMKQLSLAIREYKEARRLRPRDAQIQERLKAAVSRFRTMAAQPNAPLLRFVSHFNLSLRYWDEGKTALAIKQAEYSVDLLNAEGLPSGCADHNLEAMRQLTARFRKTERNLLQSLEKSKSVKNMYRLGVLYFDKRMLVKAEEQMKKTENMIKGAFSLAQTKWDAEKSEKILGDLEGVQDDLVFCRKLRHSLCQNDKPLMCCFTNRFEAPQASCIAWLEDIGPSIFPLEESCYNTAA